ncbi:MAG: 50S ribosomal protein L25 [Planctomycetota bacterium]
MQIAKLKAENRTAIGRNQVAHLRKEGWLPGVVYGGGGPSVNIQLSEWELEQHVHHHHRVYRIDLDGRPMDAYLQEIQWDAINDRMRHVDFKRIDLSKPIEVEIEITFVGHPAGLSKGGVLIKDHTSIMIRCLPTRIPEAVEANISGLDMDQSLRASDLDLPEGVELAIPPDQILCHVAEAVVHAEAEAPAAPEGEAEGEPAGEGEGESGEKEKKKED